MHDCVNPYCDLINSYSSKLLELENIPECPMESLNWNQEVYHEKCKVSEICSHITSSTFVSVRHLQNPSPNETKLHETDETRFITTVHLFGCSPNATQGTINVSDANCPSFYTSVLVESIILLESQAHNSSVTLKIQNNVSKCCHCKSEFCNHSTMKTDHCEEIFGKNEIVVGNERKKPKPPKPDIGGVVGDSSTSILSTAAWIGIIAVIVGILLVYCGCKYYKLVCVGVTHAEVNDE